MELSLSIVIPSRRKIVPPPCGTNIILNYLMFFNYKLRKKIVPQFRAQERLIQTEQNTAPTTTILLYIYRFKGQIRIMLIFYEKTCPLNVPLSLSRICPAYRDIL